MKTALLSLLALTLAASAQTANEIRIQQRLPDNSAYVMRAIVPPAASANGMVLFDGSTQLPKYVLMGTGMGYNGTSLSVANVPMADITGLTAAMALKQDSIAVGTSSQYYRGDKVWTTLNAACIPDFNTAVGAAMSGTFDPVGSASTAQAYAVQRANHTGVQAISTITGLQTALDSKYPTPAGTTLQYVRGDGSLATTPTGTVTSVGLTSSDFTITGSPITTSGTLTVNLNTSGITAGTYTAVTVNSKGIATAGFNRTFSTPTFASSTTATQLSATQDAIVQYGYDATVTISLLAGQSVTATLKYADNSGMTTNPVTIDVQKTQNSGVLNLTQTNTLKLGGVIPAGKYRQVTFAVAGGATAPSALVAAQEVLNP